MRNCNGDCELCHSNVTNGFEISIWGSESEKLYHLQIFILSQLYLDDTSIKADIGSVTHNYSISKDSHASNGQRRFYAFATWSILRQIIA